MKTRAFEREMKNLGPIEVNVRPYRWEPRKDSAPVIQVRPRGSALPGYFPPTILFLFMGIFTLNVLDAIFTLCHLQRGGEELNPLVALMIDLGPQPFFFIKSGITVLSLFFLMVYVKASAAKRIFGGIFGVYLAILFYHLYLASIL